MHLTVSTSITHALNGTPRIEQFRHSAIRGQKETKMASNGRAAYRRQTTLRNRLQLKIIRVRLFYTLHTATTLFQIAKVQRKEEE